MISGQPISVHKYIVSQRGKCMLTCNGYKYVETSRKSGITSWRCSVTKKRRYFCHAKAYTKLQDGVEIVTFKESHCHDAQY